MFASVVFINCETKEREVQFSCKLMPAYFCADGRIADGVCVCVSTVVIWTAAGETGADSSRSGPQEIRHPCVF